MTPRRRTVAALVGLLVVPITGLATVPAAADAGCSLPGGGCTRKVCIEVWIVGAEVRYPCPEGEVLGDPVDPPLTFDRDDFAECDPSCVCPHKTASEIYYVCDRS